MEVSTCRVSVRSMDCHFLTSSLGSTGFRKGLCQPPCASRSILLLLLLRLRCCDLPAWWADPAAAQFLLMLGGSLANGWCYRHPATA